MKMALPKELLSRLQYAFVGNKYTSGIFVVPSIKEEALNEIFKAFFLWCDEQGLINEDKLDLSNFVEKVDE